MVIPPLTLQLVRERVRLQSQVEALLEEGRIKLSSVISDLLGLSGLPATGGRGAYGEAKDQSPCWW